MGYRAIKTQQDVPRWDRLKISWCVILYGFALLRPNENYFGPSDCIHWSLLAKAVAYLTTVQSILLILAISLIWGFFLCRRPKPEENQKLGPRWKEGSSSSSKEWTHSVTMKTFSPSLSTVGGEGRVPQPPKMGGAGQSRCAAKTNI